MLNNTETHLNMMKNPDLWPCWPYLPLIKEAGEVGVLIDSDKGFVVILANMFMLPEKVDTTNSIKYDSAESIIADSWMVD
jgi:hypothetical protein